VFTLLHLLVQTALALDNGVGRLPPMGYNTWNDFRCRRGNLTADNIAAVADSLQSSGLFSLGYTYLNIDDCWAVGRDKITRRLVPDPLAFPDGVGAVADALHARGFGFGIYADRGLFTCAGRPGSQVVCPHLRVSELRSGLE
jgi:alpha-galactosidase